MKTPYGELACACAATYHVNWLTYAHDRAAGKIGLETLVAKTYERALEMESSNDTDYSIDVKKKDLDEWDKPRLARFIANGFFGEHDLGLVMQDLCNRDILPPGKYIVRVSW